MNDGEELSGAAMNLMSLINDCECEVELSYMKKMEPSFFYVSC